MKKQEFISELKRELSQAPIHIREEILADISEHFTEATAQGMSEEEVCRNLGQPGTIAAQVLEEYGEARSDKNHETGGLEMFIDGFGKVVDGFTQQFSAAGQEEEIDIDKTFTGIRDIKIKMNESKVRFAPSEDGNVRVTIRGRMRNANINIISEEGTLIITDNAAPFRFNFFRFKSSLATTIYVPSQFDGSIKARTAAGNVSASDISGQIDFKTAAGNVTVENHRGKKIRINTAAGNTLYHSTYGRAESVDITTAAGNANITAQETGCLSLTSAAGNVEAVIQRLAGDTRISTAAGSVKVTAYDVAGNIDVSTAAGSAKITIPANANIRIDAKKPVMGSITSELTGNPNAPYTLKASSSVGSIKIKAI
jgi:DUF4097 and DUF4098 domain-containing protein YvlB